MEQKLVNNIAMNGRRLLLIRLAAIANPKAMSFSESEVLFRMHKGTKAAALCFFIYLVFCGNAALINAKVFAEDFVNTTGARMVYIEAGVTDPVFRANASSALNAFYLSATEVSCGQFEKFVKETRYRTDAEKNGKSFSLTWRKNLKELGPNYPVARVSFGDACAYCRWLSSVEPRKYRLPTEAEWVHACGSDFSDTIKKHELIACGTGPKNKRGLTEMLGNVREWCDSFYSETSPSALICGESFIVTRGGSYDSWKTQTPGSRDRAAAGHENPSVGFRVACD